MPHFVELPAPAPFACASVSRSSTLATVGAIAGVGLWEGRSGFNAWLFVKMVSGWILTIIASVSLTCEPACGQILSMRRDLRGA